MFKYYDAKISLESSRFAGMFPTTGAPCALCGHACFCVAYGSLVYDACPDCDESFILDAVRARHSDRRQFAAHVEQQINRLALIAVVFWAIALLSAWIYKDCPAPFYFDWR